MYPQLNAEKFRELIKTQSDGPQTLRILRLTPDSPQSRPCRRPGLSWDRRFTFGLTFDTLR
jgi:hypothetical protein